MATVNSNRIMTTSRKVPRVTTGYFHWRGKEGCERPVRSEYDLSSYDIFEVQSEVTDDTLEFHLQHKYLFWARYSSLTDKSIKVWVGPASLPAALKGLVLEFTPHPIRGKSFAFTGGMGTLTRESAIDALLQRGAVYHGKITSKTNFLVVSPSYGNTKISDAFKHKTPILDGKEFEETLVSRPIYTL